MESFWDVMDAYKKQFGEYLPLYEILGATEEELIEIAKKCMRTGKAYESKSYAKDVMY